MELSYLTPTYEIGRPNTPEVNIVEVSDLGYVPSKV